MSSMFVKEGVVAGSPGAWERIQERFAVEPRETTLGSRRLRVPELVDPMAYLEQRMATMREPVTDLPFWTKIWPAAVVLATFVDTRCRASTRVLELGAGLGIPGLVAACGGHQTVITDLEPDALEFARAGIELNDLQEKARVMALDWANPPGDLGRFPVVLGSEVVYHAPLFPDLLNLLERVLEPGGTAFLSHQERPFAVKFFGLALQRFSVRSTSCQVRSSQNPDEPVKVYVHAMQRHPCGRDRGAQ